MKRLLVVVDYQKDFIDGALGFKGAELIAPRIVELIKEFEANNDDVVFTLDTHFDDYLETVEGKNLPIKHCLKNTKGWGFADEIDALTKGHSVFEKQGFGSDALGEYVKQNQYDEIYLCGLVSDICVFSNAIIVKAFSSPITKIKVVQNATSSGDLLMEEKSFEMLKHLHIEII